MAAGRWRWHRECLRRLSPRRPDAIMLPASTLTRPASTRRSTTGNHGSWCKPSRGRGAVFADTGMGKTDANRMGATHRPILAHHRPLSVARQTVRESRQDRRRRALRPPPLRRGTRNRVHHESRMADKFNPAQFDAVALDESSILKNFTGATRTADRTMGEHPIPFVMVGNPGAERRHRTV